MPPRSPAPPSATRVTSWRQQMLNLNELMYPAFRGTLVYHYGNATADAGARWDKTGASKRGLVEKKIKKEKDTKNKNEGKHLGGHKMSRRVVFCGTSGRPWVRRAVPRCASALQQWDHQSMPGPVPRRRLRKADVRGLGLMSRHAPLPSIPRGHMHAFHLALVRGARVFCRHSKKFFLFF